MNRRNTPDNAVREVAQSYATGGEARDRLRRELQKGLDSGIAEDFDFDRFIEETFGPE